MNLTPVYTWEPYKCIRFIVSLMVINIWFTCIKIGNVGMSVCYYISLYSFILNNPKIGLNQSRGQRKKTTTPKQ